MDVDYTDEQAAYRDAVRRFAQDHVAAIARALPAGRAVDRAEADAIVDRLRGFGIIDHVPTHDDGTPDLIGQAILAEELARVSASVTWILFPLLFGRTAIAPFFDEARRERYGHLLGGDHVVCVGITEPDAGSNPAQIQTVARRDGDGFVIDGSKLWITSGSVSDACIVICRVEGREGRGAIAPFLVERAIAPYEARPVACIGMEAVPTCEMTFRECRVPAEAELVPPGQGFARVLDVLVRARCFVAITAVGIAQGALDLATQYSRDRTQFGRPIAGFQLVQELLADMATEIEAGRLLTYRALSLISSGARAVKEASMAKAYCTEMAVRASSAGIQAQGAIGLSREHAAERLLRDARMLTIPDGTTQIQKLIIGRELTGVSALV